MHSYRVKVNETFFCKTYYSLKLLLKPDTLCTASIAKTQYMIITMSGNDSINTFLPIIEIEKRVLILLKHHNFSIFFDYQ